MASADDEDPLIGDLSEGAVLRAILARTAPAAHALLGPGDDAAVITTPSGAVVATADTLVHGPDFRTTWTTGYDLGWKAAAVNLADVAAMGATPTALLVSLAVPRGTRLSYVTQMADGLREACAALAPGCAVVGGDLTVSELMMVAVTALGDLGGRTAVTRAGARPGDVIALAGELGVAAAGLDLLFQRFRDGETPVAIDSTKLDAVEQHALDRQLRPHPPIGLAPAAADAGASAMMDVSDGLTLDAGRMAEASGAAIDFSGAALDALAFGGDRQRALAGGEDHGLLAAFPSDAVREHGLPAGFQAIGVVIEGREHGVLVDGTPVVHSGWDPYRDWDGVVSD
ncbi:Thiamine-monophosphate kinase [Microbacterium esteraromaticum]|uniref:Thiamine-monophosphate kinase n=1 Tax=Microbacterium esteraromaticum TaxID=57043 RepID=A0A1R4IG72_9MICO|nr:thiamine-phosphate kinase [Microbacterium esteraromaticum]SJN18343.1 Thiamine-monophosphate kinase [Microbacterium esteraromaticum]